MPYFNSQDFGITLNGLAKMDVFPTSIVPSFYDHVRELAGPKLPSFNAQVGR